MLATRLFRDVKLWTSLAQMFEHHQLRLDCLLKNFLNYRSNFARLRRASSSGSTSRPIAWGRR
jgi:hypothetical protein